MEIEQIDFKLDNCSYEQFNNIIYRNNIVIDKELDNVINKYTNLDTIDEPYATFFETYEEYNKNRNFFWIVISLYCISENELFDFTYTLLNHSVLYDLYTQNYSYNSLKLLYKNSLLKLLKDYINMNKMNLLFFLIYFKFYF